MSDKDVMHSNQDKETYESHPYFSRKSPEERDILKQETTNNCLTLLNQQEQLSNMEAAGKTYHKSNDNTQAHKH